MELSGAPDLSEQGSLPAYHLLHLQYKMSKNIQLLIMNPPVTFDVVSTTTYSIEGLNFVDCKLVSFWAPLPP